MPTPFWTWMLIAGAGSVAACAAGPRAGAVTGRVREAAPSLESVAYATVVLSFTSRSDRTVRVSAYEIVWPRGRFRVTASELSLAAGETKEQRVRVPASAGDVDALVHDPAAATVEAIAAR